ncbi:MAG: hypothetical protein RL380_457 [Verrucomicrobiota bacterium]|jgi:peptidyl-prolyl cis-trans isomerase B (cyclophilin B)
MPWKILRPMKNLFAICAFGVALGLSACHAESTNQPAAKPTETKTETKEEKPVSANTNEVAIIKTSEGEMVVEFYPDVAPGHVENFKKLAAKGFYDGTCFHRVIKGFMIQGGDPLTKDEANAGRWGTGGPGYQIKAEFNSKPHVRGTLSMARSNDPNSAGSQFFICHGAPSFLDGQYTVFGKLLKGDDVLEKIGTTACAPGDRPLKRMNIESVKLVARDSVK